MSPVAPVLLEAVDLRAGFGANTVLHGVSLKVRRGTIHAVLGLNGAGKSVLMKVIGGVVPTWGGRVFLGGDDVTGASVEERVARGMGHVPQGRQLFPELTVEENLRLGAYLLRRRNPRRYEPLLDDLYDRFPRLRERRTQLGGSLSGGEQAMLAVARALVNEPSLILVDEPSAGLAPVVAHEVFELLRSVNRDGVTMLLIEQNVALALSVAHRVGVLQRGQLVYDIGSRSVDHAKLGHYLGIGRLLSGASSANGGARRTRAKAATGKGKR